MNQTILFTPVGGTDPISSTNCRDGSMLHICRIYKPDKVIMYMTKEMLAYQEEDNRYLYCLERLAKMQKREMEYETIERRELTKVHEFDYFYQDFRVIIEQIYEKMDDTDVLLLNISSGTPAMKSGLLVLQTLGEFPAKLIQVATPEKRINEHIHRDYDVVTLWELNEDNEEGCLNRCKEVQCPTLSKIKKEEIIKKHILAYDYKAALDVADTLEKEETENYRDLLYMASRRLMLDFANVDAVIRKTGMQCLPVRTSSERKYFEYALNMEIRLKKEEYVDFVRSITPLIVDLFEMVLEKREGIKIDDYCERYRKKCKGAVAKLADKVGSTAGQQEKHLVELVQNLRFVEENIRNLAAHEIMSVTEDTLQKMTGFSGNKIMNMIKELFHYTGLNIKKEYWDSYDKMNQMILERI